MLRRVALLALPGFAPFEFGVVCEVFGIDRTGMGGPAFDFVVAAADPGPVRTSLGFDVMVEHGLDVVADADLVAVTSHPQPPTDPRVLQMLRDAQARGAWVLSVCSGAFVLAEAGLLAGRRATTHWMYTEAFAARYPSVEVDPDVLFVEDGNIITSAGTASGIDACLHLVRNECGSAVANVVARRMVVPPQRDGGQSQYIAAPVVDRPADSFAGVTDWMLEHLDEDQPVELLARRALMSPRTFARRFRADTGTTPAAWLTRQRLLRARTLLESTDLGLEQVAQRCGFGAASVLRHHFARVLGTTPTAYRRAFGERRAG